MPETENIAIAVLLSGAGVAMIALRMMWYATEKARELERATLIQAVTREESRTAELTSISTVISSIETRLARIQERVDAGFTHLSDQHTDLKKDHRTMWQHIKPRSAP